ncbi:MAG TPA: thiamine pyrophosphate-binding protein [Actinomycetes bacterium]|nr:thiamine pyrophosphate-binding protein [Actinomycetes bacterium]
MTTATRILDALETVGVRTVFGLPGVHNLPFWEDVDATGARTSGLRIVGVRHEQTAAYAADGLARATGGLGVALVTSGPGAANTLAAFGEASASGIPLLVIASDVPERLRNRARPRGLLHESADPGAWFAPLAKAVFQPTTVKQALEAVADAIESALEHPRGPVYLGVPSDVLASASARGRTAQVTTPGPASTADITALADLINASARPILWVGGGAVSSEAAAEIDALAWRLGAPVFCTYAARGLLPSGHPLLIDVPAHEPAVRELLASSDLLIGLGSAFDGMTTANWTIPRPSRVVDVNLNSRGGFAPDLVIAADVRQTVDAVSIRLRSREPWADSPFRIRAEVLRAASADGRTREAVELVEAIDKAWPAEQPIVCDMAVAGYWVGGYAAVQHPRHLMYPVGWGTLGYGLPAAIGVASAGQACLAVVGDGGLAMATGELATVSQEQLPLTLLVIDDEGYGMLRFDQQRASHAERGVDLDSPRWSDLGRAFNLAVDKPSTLDDLRNVIAWSALSGEPRMIVYRAALYPPRSTSPRWADPPDSLRV